MITQTPGYTPEDEKAITHALACAQSFVNEHSNYSPADVLRVTARAALQHRARASAYPTTDANIINARAIVAMSGENTDQRVRDLAAARTSEDWNRD